MNQVASFTMLVSCLAYSSTLEMEAASSSETSADFQRTTRRYISEDLRTLQVLYSNSLNGYSRKSIIFWDVKPYSLVEAHRLSQERAVSIFMVEHMLSKKANRKTTVLNELATCFFMSSM
jgi:hypothetical protein